MNTIYQSTAAYESRPIRVLLPIGAEKVVWSGFLAYLVGAISELDIVKRNMNVVHV